MSKTIYSEEHQYLVSRLRNARIEAGLSQEEVARKLNRTQSYISKVESGQRRVDIVQLKEFAKVYKKPVSYFVK